MQCFCFFLLFRPKSTGPNPHFFIIFSAHAATFLQKAIINCVFSNYVSQFLHPLCSSLPPFELFWRYFRHISPHALSRLGPNAWFLPFLLFCWPKPASFHHFFSSRCYFPPKSHHFSFFSGDFASPLHLFSNYFAPTLLLFVYSDTLFVVFCIIWQLFCFYFAPVLPSLCFFFASILDLCWKTLLPFLRLACTYFVPIFAPILHLFRIYFEII